MSSTSWQIVNPFPGVCRLFDMHTSTSRTRVISVQGSQGGKHMSLRNPF